MMELTYTRQGDYNLPNLLPPQEKNSQGENLEIHLGKYALLRKRYLKENHKPLFVNLLTTGKLNAHLMEIEQTATERMKLLTEQMKKSQGVTEQLKATNQMAWVGLTNNIKHSAEEIILNELIYD